MFPNPIVKLKECSKMDRGDLDFVEGQINPGAIGDEIYIAFKRDITSFPTIDDDMSEATDAEAYVNLTGNFTMATGKKFTRVYNTQGLGSVDYEDAGEEDGKLFINKLECKYPKINTGIRALSKYVNNSKVILVAKHAGKFYVIGNEDYGATVKTSGTSGKKPDEAHGVTVTAQAYDHTPLPCYVGTLPLTDGTLNCETGVFTPSSN